MKPIHLLKFLAKYQGLSQVLDQILQQLDTCVEIKSERGDQGPRRAIQTMGKPSPKALSGYPIEIQGRVFGWVRGSAAAPGAFLMK